MHETNRREAGEAASTERAAAPAVVVAAMVMAALGVIGFLAAGSIAHGATGTHATVSIAKTKLGSILVGSSGRTLYLFAKDKNGKSACSGSCAQYWPPLLAHGKPTAGGGAKSSLLGTTKRAGGAVQVTYNKHPLYTYLLDKRAGQTNGEGSVAFGAHWYAVAAKGTAVVKATTTTTTTTTGTTTTTPYPYP
jgi:predicted lipoprotein with Yx(FWY)xxD motif